MDSIRVSAKTVEDALTAASIELLTSSDNIEYKVLDEGSKGFFGIGGRKAVIEAKRKLSEEEMMKEILEDKPIRPKKEFKKDFKQEKKQEKKEVKEGKKEAKAKQEPKAKIEEPKEKSEQPKAKSEQPKVKPVPKAKNEQPKVKAEKPEAPKAKEEPVAVTEETTEKVEEKKEFRREREPRREFRRDRDREGRRGYKKDRPEYKKPVAEEAAVAVAVDGNEEEAEEVVREPRVPADPAVAKQRAEDFLKDVLRTMGMEVSVSTEFEDGTLLVNIEGEDMGLMIGKRGQTLDSLQYLTSLVVNKGKQAYVRVKLDTEDYRNRRKATLENLAKNIAMKVSKTRRPVFLEPMNPYERRIIHSALQNDPYVTTHSEGDEPYRKVVVTPKRDRDGGGRRFQRYGNDRRRRYDRRDRQNRYERGENREEMEAPEFEVERTIED